MNKVYKQFTTALDELGVTVIEARWKGIRSEPAQRSDACGG